MKSELLLNLGESSVRENVIVINIDNLPPRPFAEGEIPPSGIIRFIDNSGRQVLWDIRYELPSNELSSNEID